MCLRSLGMRMRRATIIPIRFSSRSYRIEVKQPGDPETLWRQFLTALRKLTPPE